MIAKALSIVTAVCCFAVSTAVAANGTWTFGIEDRGQPELRYSENGKTIFMVACGRAFGIHAVYPGAAKKEDEKATLTIASGRMRMTLRGEISGRYDDDPPGTTHFVQWDLGYARQNSGLYGRTWEKLESRLLDLFDSGRPLRISAEGRSYRLPAVDVRGWERRFKANC